ncbi:MAG: hypothetical protein PHD82_01845, partial [Candidatus Riflebacteria bacterium]|nr:hypothetical protein [Candidatus Riflebacteria bacterium]
TKTVSGLHSNFKSPVEGLSRLHLELKNDMLIICPENIAGNVVNHLDNQTKLLGEEFAAFDKMVRNRPSLAAEISFEALNKVTKAHLPVWMKPVKHLRLIAARSMSKLQMFVPDSEQRNSLLQLISKEGERLGEPIGLDSRPGSECKGNSIFIEAPAGIDLEKTVSRRTAAFFLHFFARAQRNNPVMTAAKHEK